MHTTIVRCYAETNYDRRKPYSATSLRPRHAYGPRRQKARTACAALWRMQMNEWTKCEQHLLQVNCPHIVTFDLEHILDADRPGDHFVQVWWGSVHLPTSRSNLSATTKLPISRDLWHWSWPRAYPKCGPTWGPLCASLVTIRPFA